jgi:hypothetical protein
MPVFQEVQMQFDVSGYKLTKTGVDIQWCE